MSVFSAEVLSQVFQLDTLLLMLVGTIIGLFIGALPGLGDNLAIALMLPVTLMMSPLKAVCMLVCIYMASCYGGSISSITLGVPGTGASVCTLFDGQPLARRGEPGRALSISLTSSTVGGFIGAMALMFFTIMLMPLIYKLTDPEIACITAFGLLTLVCLNTSDGLKGILSILMGLLLATVGNDVFTGEPRFTFGVRSLLDGFSLIPVLIGVYAIPRIISTVVEKQKRVNSEIDPSKLKFHMSKEDLKSCFAGTMLGGVIGTLVGIIPGMGAGPATVFTYNIYKGVGENEKTFGTGDPKGIACVESANNACVGGALIPHLTMGIAGSGSVAVLVSDNIKY